MIRLRTCLLALAAFATPALHLQAAEYAVDGAHSSLTFKVGHFNIGEIHGRFNDLSGSFSFDAENLAASTVNISSTVGSIDTANKKRDTHLKSAEFLDAGIFPTIGFKGTSFTAVAGTDNTYAMTGIMSLHGVDKELTIHVTQLGAGIDPWGNQRIGFTSTFDINRTDFGITQHGKAVSDIITLTLACEAIVKK